jgi:hypothetical protein
MKVMRGRRRGAGLREVRLVLPDARSETVRARIAAQVAKLDPDVEQEAFAWIEAVSEFDNPKPPRAGWADAAQAIAHAGDDNLVWREFPNTGDDELEW